MNDSQGEGQQGESPHEDKFQAEKEGFREEARAALGSLDWTSPAVRRLFVKSYRQLGRLLARLQKDQHRFSIPPSDKESNILAETLRCGQFFKEYPNDPSFKFRSSFFMEAAEGNRCFRPPAVQINEEPVTAKAGLQVVRLPDSAKEFTLKIQGEPFSTVRYTNVPNRHPLLITQQQLGEHYFNLASDREVIDIVKTVPCELSIIVEKGVKAMSKVVTLKVVAQSGGAEYQSLFDNRACRPAESFPFEDSHISGESQIFSNSQDKSASEGEAPPIPDDND